MAIVLFAIIGATINAGTGYWICFSIYCFFTVIRAIKETIKEKGW
jgi:hypothetical protein